MKIATCWVLRSLPLIVLFHPAASLVQGQTLTYAGPQPSLNFGSVNICPAGSSTPSPCSETLSLTYNVTEGGTLGTPKVLTLGAPNLDFTLASGGTCTGTVTTGTTCTVKVTFAPLFAGVRNGAVELTDESGDVLATTLIYGNGVGPQVVFGPATQTLTSIDGFNSNDGVVGMVVDGEGNVYISESVYEGVSRVVKLPAGGGNQTTVGTGLSSPVGLAIDGAGNLFIADTSNSRVVKVIAADGSQTTVGTGLLKPQSVAIDGAGDIFIADTGNERVVEVPVDGGPQTTVYDGSADDEGISRIAVDGPGNLFVSTGTTIITIDPFSGVGSYSYSYWVVKVPVGGGPQTTLWTGGGGSSYEEYNNDEVYSVAVDGAGDVYLGVSYFQVFEDDPPIESDSVVEIQAGGTAQTTVFYTDNSTPGVVFDYFQLALDGSGNLFLSDVYPSSVMKVARSAPPTLNFGTTDGATTPQSVSVGNIGNAALAITNISVSPSFTQITGGGTPPDCGAGLSVAPGMECDVTISFLPVITGFTTGSLTGGATLTDNMPGATQTIILKGTDLVVQVSASSLNFGSVPIYSGQLQPLTITNGGTATLTVTPSINGPSYTVASSTCGAGIKAGTSCTLQINYSPITVGLHNDSLTLQTNGPGNPVVSLLGSAFGLNASTAILEFGAIPYGTTKVLPLTILIAGESSVTLSTTVNDPSYKILTTGNTCLNGFVQPGVQQSCTLPVEFDPAVVGVHNAILTITPTPVPDPGPSPVRLLGSASMVAPTTSTLNFGSIAYGTTSTLLLTIQDVGAPGVVTLATSINGPSYKILVAGNTCLSGLRSGNSCVLPVEFDPVAVGLHNDYLTITPTTGGVSVLPLLGSASQP